MLINVAFCLRSIALEQNTRPGCHIHTDTHDAIDGNSVALTNCPAQGRCCWFTLDKTRCCRTRLILFAWMPMCEAAWTIFFRQDTCQLLARYAQPQIKIGLQALESQLRDHALSHNAECERVPKRCFRIGLVGVVLSMPVGWIPPRFYELGPANSVPVDKELRTRCCVAGAWTHPSVRLPASLVGTRSKLLQFLRAGQSTPTARARSMVYHRLYKKRAINKLVSWGPAH